MKNLKTPLRYPGGKSKAIKTLSPWFPKTISEYREPFIGGGSIAIEITKSNPDIPVWINDLYVPLYNFWVQLRDSGEELSERVREEKQRTLDEGDKDKVTASAKELFNRYKEEIDTYDDLEKAVAFFILNKCSFSGLTENSTFSQTASNSNFSLNCLNFTSKIPSPNGSKEKIVNWNLPSRSKRVTLHLTKTLIPTSGVKSRDFLLPANITAFIFELESFKTRYA